jgi:hypothetical protein
MAHRIAESAESAENQHRLCDGNIAIAIAVEPVGE